MNCKTCGTTAENRVFTTFSYWHCPKCKDDAEISRNTPKGDMDLHVNKDVSLTPPWFQVELSLDMASGGGMIGGNVSNYSALDPRIVKDKGTFYMDAGDKISVMVSQRSSSGAAITPAGSDLVYLHRGSREVVTYDITVDAVYDLYRKSWRYEWRCTLSCGHGPTFHEHGRVS